VFVALTHPATRVEIDGSLIIAADLLGLVTRWYAATPDSTAFKTVDVSNSVLQLRSPGGEPSSGFTLLATTLEPVVADPTAAAFVAHCSAEARRGAAPDIVDLRARLHSS